MKTQFQSFSLSVFQSFSKSVLQHFSISALQSFSLLFILSFLLFACSPTFTENITEMSNLTLSIPGGIVQLSGNPILCNCTSDRTGVTQQKMLLEILSTDGAVSGGSWIDSIEGTDVTFDIHQIVDGEFDYDFDTDFTAKVIEHNLLAANFEILVGESYVDANGDYQEYWPPSDTAGTFENIVVIKGKLTNYEYDVLAAAGSSFYDKYILNPRFLTNRFNEEFQRFNISNQTDDVKAWMYQYNTTTLIYFIVEYTDGSNETTLLTDFVFSSGKLYEFNLSAFVAEYADPLKTIEYYILATANNEQLWVYPSHKYEENHNELLILNNLGGVEVLHCYGEFTETTTSDKDIYTTAKSTTSNFLQGTKVAQSKGNTDKYKINTGYKTLNERRWIKQLLGSNKAWLKSESILHLSGKTYGIVPVVISAGSFTIDTTSTDNLAIEIEIEIAHIN